MPEQRRYPRKLDLLELNITSPTGEIQKYTTRDVSDAGIFVYANFHNQFPVGTEITITLTQHFHRSEQPVLRGRVAHRDSQGMGIEFLDREPE